MLRRDSFSIPAFELKRQGKKMREKLTKNDVKKIQEEIEHRKLVERKELIEAVKEARAL